MDATTKERITDLKTVVNAIQMDHLKTSSKLTSKLTEGERAIAREALNRAPGSVAKSSKAAFLLMIDSEPEERPLAVRIIEERMLDDFVYAAESLSIKILGDSPNVRIYVAKGHDSYRNGDVVVTTRGIKFSKGLHLVWEGNERFVKSMRKTIGKVAEVLV